MVHIDLVNGLVCHLRESWRENALVTSDGRRYLKKTMSVRGRRKGGRESESERKVAEEGVRVKV